MRVAIIGVFDGVHVGHRSLIHAARAVAGEGRVTALTFDPHPRLVITGSAPSFLATLPHRVELLREAGVDDVQILNFDTALAALSPEDFISDVLVNRYGITDVVVGENFRFGAHSAGGVADLAQAGLRVHPQALLADADGRWSSTRIRDNVKRGDVAQAAVGLARLYRLEGEVIHGEQRGRGLGYPTANLAWDSQATVPGDGVYAGFFGVADQRFPAAISVGTNPQFAGNERSVEAYVLDRDDLDVYGAQVRVDFQTRLRAQARFADVAALQAQMAKDVDAARSTLR
jgi:riboflavin kinase / FMN adenylyltransferase